jgi:acyl-coenzyme A synthetase/AMP-(fatty) acid ligase
MLLKFHIMLSSLLHYFSRPDDFKAVAMDIEDTSNILFSSGTTGENEEVHLIHLLVLSANMSSLH